MRLVLAWKAFPGPGKKDSKQVDQRLRIQLSQFKELAWISQKLDAHFKKEDNTIHPVCDQTTKGS